MRHYASPTVGDFVVMFDQGDARDAQREHTDTARYTLAELHYVGGRALTDKSPEMRAALQAIGRVKRAFPAAVIRGDQPPEWQQRRYVPRKGPIMENHEADAYDEARRVRCAAGGSGRALSSMKK